SAPRWKMRSSAGGHGEPAAAPAWALARRDAPGRSRSRAASAARRALRLEACMSGRGRINLHSPYLFPVLRPGTTEFVVGAEVQQAVIARGLAARGFDVSVATCDYGQGRRVSIDGITVLATFPPHRGVPVLRFFHPRLTKSYRALLAADAEVYYARCSGLPPALRHAGPRWRRAPSGMPAAHADTGARG